MTINSSLANGAEISNQGTVYWDTNENGTNDATELTDDPVVDDGVDLDGDGETDDDDPTNIVVFAYEPPSMLTEDFSDDTPGRFSYLRLGDGISRPSPDLQPEDVEAGDLCGRLGPAALGLPADTGGLRSGREKGEVHLVIPDRARPPGRACHHKAAYA